MSPVRGLASTEDGVDIAELLDRRRQRARGRVGVAALEDVVLEQDALVGAHREHLLDGGLRALLAGAR